MAIGYMEEMNSARFDRTSKFFTICDQEDPIAEELGTYR